MPSTFYWNSTPWIVAPKEAMALASNDVKNEAQRLARWAHVRSSVHVVGGGNEYVLTASSPDAKFLEGGTGPHTIDPAGGGPAKVLKFKNGGFASGPVPHPGTEAHPFLHPASDMLPAFFQVRGREVMPK